MSNLPSKRAGGKRRKVHPVTPPWSWEADDTPTPPGEMYDGEPERSDPEYRAAVDERMMQAHGECEARLPGCWERTDALDPHHVYPISEGGRIIVAVAWLRIVCRSCHGKIHGSERRTAEDAGLIVPRHIKSDTVVS